MGQKIAWQAGHYLAGELPGFTLFFNARKLIVLKTQGSGRNPESLYLALC